MSHPDIGEAEHRRLAAQCFNGAWDMIEADRTPENDEEMLRRAYASAYHWQHAEGRAPVSTEAMLKRFREGGTVRPPYRIGGRWLELSEQKTPNGRTVGVRADITDLKNQEIEAARARVRYQTLVDSLSDVVFELDGATGRLTYMSASVASLLERPAAEVTGSNFLDHIAPASKDEVLRQVSRPWDENDTARFYRFHVITASGKTKAVEVHSRRRIDEEGRIVTTGVIRDIEERIRLEQQLAEETARLRSIFETGGVVMALMAPDLRYLTVNQGFCAAVGLPADQIVGRTPHEVMGGVGLDLEMLDRNNAELARTMGVTPEHPAALTAAKAANGPRGRGCGCAG